MNELILGGARSGKSSLAERLASACSGPVTYLATATAGDDEMRRRIERHRSRRPDDWHTVEEPLRLASTLRAYAVADGCVVVDCLTLWLSNLLQMADGEHFVAEREALFEVLPTLPGRVILVSNEVGMGIVPLGALSRRFQDESGLLHQRIARLCDRVILTVAGLPQVLKGETI